MNAYKYDDKGLYIGVVECQIDPLETRKKGETVYLLPRNATYETPLEAKDGYNVVWNDSEWTYVEIPKEEETEPYVPTTEDKLAALDAQYDSEKAKIRQAYFDAMIAQDTEQMAKLQADLDALNDKYDEDYDALESEGE